MLKFYQSTNVGTYVFIGHHRHELFKLNGTGLVLGVGWAVDGERSEVAALPTFGRRSANVREESSRTLSASSIICSISSSLVSSPRKRIISLTSCFSMVPAVVRGGGEEARGVGVGARGVCVGGVRGVRAGPPTVMAMMGELLSMAPRDPAGG